MKNNEILMFLRKIELFRNLDDQEYKELAKSVNEKTFKSGDLLFTENGPRKNIFIIFKERLSYSRVIHSELNSD